MRALLLAALALPAAAQAQDAPQTPGGQHAPAQSGMRTNAISAVAHRCRFIADSCPLPIRAEHKV